MKQEDFQAEYHWLIGLREYFDAIGEGDRYEIIFKALYHDNWYRKRDVLTELYQKHDIETEKHLKSWMNLILHQHLTDIEIKPQLVVTLIRKYMMEDPLLVNTAKFINYWSGSDGEGAKVPDLNDFFSKGQVQSKLWLIKELKNIVDGSLGNVVFYGGWYNFAAHFVMQNFDANDVYSIDLNDETVEPCKRLYDREYRHSQFHPIAYDVGKIRWDGKKMLYCDFDRREEQVADWMSKQEGNLSEKRQQLIDTWLEKQEEKYAADIEAKEDEIRMGYTSKEKIREDIFRDKDQVIEKISEDLRNEVFGDKDDAFDNFGWRNIIHATNKEEYIDNDNKLQDKEKIDLKAKFKDTKINTVINTSCEHMDNSWYENLPDGTFVILHQNDYFENEQHSNCCKDLDEVKSKYPMSEIYYEGELDTNLYNRFMLIGVK
jgi:hypothetical protein